MIQLNVQNFRRAGLFGLAIAATLSLHAARGLAADSSERPFDPPVGSRWIIESEINTDDVRPDGTRTSQIKSRAEMTIDAKTADGLRITYVHRGTTADGNDPTLPLVRTAMQTLDNVPIRATTDRHGKPVRVDNLDESKAALRGMAVNLTAPFKDKPQLLDVLKRMMASFIEVDAERAASTYIDALPELAKAQSTGMKPGEIRRSTSAVDNPLGGGAMKSNSSFELKEADAATGRRTFINTTSYDADSMKEFTQVLSKKLLAGAGNGMTPQQVDSILKSMVLSLDQRAVFEVEDGMTRKITEKSVTAVRALGQNMQKTENRTITVTSAP